MLKFRSVPLILIFILLMTSYLNFTQGNLSQEDNSPVINDIPQNMSEMQNLFDSLKKPKISRDGINPGFTGFVKNIGQSSNTDILYYYTSSQSSVGFSTSQIHFSKNVDDKQVVFTISFPGSNHIIPKGLNALEHSTNYFIGNRQLTNIESDNEILFYNIYKNIDLRYYMSVSGLKYEFIVHPGGNPNDITIEVSGNMRLSTSKTSIALFEKSDLNSQIYVDNDLNVFQGLNVIISASFTQISINSYGFNIEKYDSSIDLIIDPIWLGFSTFLGGDMYDQLSDIAIDDQGNTYLTGYTESTNFPNVNGIYQSLDTSPDAFVTKLNSTGNGIIYSTYLGGDDIDKATSIDVDQNGYPVVVGYTSSSNFPIWFGYYAIKAAYNDAFITRLNFDGTLNYSTYWGGDNTDVAFGVYVSDNGDTYITGNTYSTDFPLYNESSTVVGNGDVFVIKLNATRFPYYSTYIGGSDSYELGYGIAADEFGNAYITGETSSTDYPVVNGMQSYINSTDSFLTKLDENGSIIYSTYIGGLKDDWAYSISVDDNHDVFLSGTTTSSDLPTKNPIQTYQGSYDAFALKINNTGNGLIFGTYLGGTSPDGANSHTLDPYGNMIIAGGLFSPDFPTKEAYLNYSGGNDGFITKLNSTGTGIIFSTFIGGTGLDFVVSVTTDKVGNILAVGRTNSSSFPTLNPLQNSYGGGEADGFLMKISVDKFGTILGGSDNDYANNMVIDGEGNIYLGGTTNSVDFSAYNTFSITRSGYDIYLMKLNSTGNGIIWSTYYGGDSSDSIQGISIDSIGNIVFSGDTMSSDFPLINEYQATRFGLDIYVAKLNSTGNGIIFSSIIGGTADDYSFTFTMDTNDNLYVAGATFSNDYPVYNEYMNFTGGGVDAILTKLNSTGNGIVYSTYFGGAGLEGIYGIDVDKSGNVIVVGETQSSDFPIYLELYGDKYSNDAFIAKFNTSGGLIFSTYYGGEGIDSLRDVVLDEEGYAYITGYTYSDDLPVVNFIQNFTYSEEAFVLKMSPNGQQIEFATYLGGIDDDFATDITRDKLGNIYITGGTRSSDFFVLNPSQTWAVNATTMVFITVINKNATQILYSTLLGGAIDQESKAIAIDLVGNAWLAGKTNSQNFPTTYEFQSIPTGDNIFLYKYGMQFDEIPPEMNYVSVSANEILSALSDIFFDFSDNTQVGRTYYNWDGGVNTTFLGSIPVTDIEGPHQLNVFYTDAANNLKLYSIALGVDGAAPIISPLQDKIIELGTSNVNIEWDVFDYYPTTYTLTKNDVEIDSGTWTSGVNISTLIDSNSLGDLTYNLTIEDALGNHSSEVVKVTIVDTTAPSIEPIVNLQVELGSTSNVISWKGTDLAPNNYTLYRNGTIIDTGFWASGTNNSRDIDGLSVGAYNYTILIFDQSGNYDLKTFYVTVVDTTNPQITKPTEPRFEYGVSGASVDWNAFDFDPATYNAYLNGSLIDSGSWNTQNPIQINLGPLEIGQYNLTLVIFDQSGNIDQASIIFVVSDTTKPSFDLGANKLANQNIKAGETITIYLEDYGKIDHIEYSWNDGDFQTLNPLSSALIMNQALIKTYFDIPVPEKLNGKSKLTIIAYDDSGNSDTYIWNDIYINGPQSGLNLSDYYIYAIIAVFLIFSLFIGKKLLFSSGGKQQDERDRHIVKSRISTHIPRPDAPQILSTDKPREPPNIFISFSSNDLGIAEQLYERLEDIGAKPWLSSKSIDLGDEYNLQILDAIDTAKLFVLLVSRVSVASRHVGTELERAFGKGARIMPILLENVTIPRGWEYFLSTSQWTNVSNKSETQWIPVVVASLNAKLTSDSSSHTTSQTSPQNKMLSDRCLMCGYTIADFSIPCDNCSSEVDPVQKRLLVESDPWTTCYECYTPMIKASFMETLKLTGKCPHCASRLFYDNYVDFMAETDFSNKLGVELGQNLGFDDKEGLVKLLSQQILDKTIPLQNELRILRTDQIKAGKHSDHFSIYADERQSQLLGTLKPLIKTIFRLQIVTKKLTRFNFLNITRDAYNIIKLDVFSFANPSEQKLDLLEILSRHHHKSQAIKDETRKEFGRQLANHGDEQVKQEIDPLVSQYTEKPSKDLLQSILSKLMNQNDVLGDQGLMNIVSSILVL